MHSGTFFNNMFDLLGGSVPKKCCEGRLAPSANKRILSTPHLAQYSLTQNTGLSKYGGC
jgi:hypothetical protein